MMLFFNCDVLLLQGLQTLQALQTMQTMQAMQTMQTMQAMQTMLSDSDGLGQTNAWYMMHVCSVV